MLSVDGESWEIDQAQSFLGAFVTDSDRVQWFLTLQSAKPVFESEKYQLEIGGMRFPIRSWKELGGRSLDYEQFQIEREAGVKSRSPNGPSAFLYRPEMGQHEILSDLRLRIGRREGARFEVELECVSGIDWVAEPDATIVRFNAVLPFKQACMSVERNCTAEQAKARFRRHFETSDFLEPKFDGISCCFPPAVD